MTKLEPVTLPVCVRGEHHGQRGDLFGRREAAGRDAAHAGHDRLPGRVGIDAGRLGDGGGDAGSPSQRSVPTGPGETALTRMPCGPNSWDSDLVRLTSAALAAP